jgi:hypothetical protein
VIGEVVGASARGREHGETVARDEPDDAYLTVGSRDADTASGQIDDFGARFGHGEISCVFRGEQALVHFDAGIKRILRRRFGDIDGR